MTAGDRSGPRFAGAVSLLCLAMACQESTIHLPATGGSADAAAIDRAGSGGSGGGTGGSSGAGTDAGVSDGGRLGRWDGSFAGNGGSWQPGWNGGRLGGQDAMTSGGALSGGAGGASSSVASGGAAGSSGGRGGGFGLDARLFGWGDVGVPFGGAQAIDAESDGPRWSSCAQFSRCGTNEIPVRMQGPGAGVQGCACVPNPCGAAMPSCSCAGTVCGPSATCAGYMPDSGFLVCSQRG